MIRRLNDLVRGTQSMKDRRIGTMLLGRLSRGYITAHDYEETGDESR